MDDTIAADRLLMDVESEIAQAKERIEAHEERLALSEIDDGKSPATHAIEALGRPERFRGEHHLARTYLELYAPTVGIFKREPDERP